MVDFGNMFSTAGTAGIPRIESRRTHLSEHAERFRLGVVSDTHNHLANCNRIVELFNDAQVDAVVHTGDITQAKTIDAFAALDAPLLGVFGNNDVERPALLSAIERHGFEFCDPPHHLLWRTRRIVVVHDPNEFAGALEPDHDLALHGHTHRRRIEQEAETLFFNPGECAGHVAGLNAVGVVELAALTTEILQF